MKEKIRELLTRKIPRDQYPFWCIAGFICAVGASLILSTLVHLALGLGW